MENNKITEKIKASRFYLNKIVANKIDKKPEQGSIKMIQESEYKIMENTNEKLAIKVNTKVFVEPETLFSIEIEHIIEYMLADSISKDEINKGIETLLNPLGSEVSFIISAISKEMIDLRIVLPPKLDLKPAIE